MSVISSLCLCVSLSILYASTATASPTISSNLTIAKAGYFQLSWEVADNTPIRLETSNFSDFTHPVLLYQGSASSRVITGLENGDYFYRVITSNGVSSEPIKVQVKHHSIKHAVIFFCMGLFLFCILIGILITANKKAK